MNNVLLTALLTVGCLLSQGKVFAQTESPPEQPQPATQPAAQPAPAKKPVEIPLDRQAYRVQVAVRFGDSVRLDENFRRELVAELRQQVSNHFGNLWEAEVQDYSWFLLANRLEQNWSVWPWERTPFPQSALVPNTAAGLDRYNSETARQQFSRRWHKVFWVLVEMQGRQYRVSGREYDQGTWQLTGRYDAVTYNREAVSLEAVKLLRRLFRPNLLVTASQDYDVTLQLQGGQLRPGDPDFEQVQTGQVAQPHFVYFDKNRVPQQVQPLPLTYVMLENRTEGVLQGTFISGLKLALGGVRRRVETRVLLLRPQYPETTVELISRTEPDTPLTGYQISLIQKKLSRDQELSPPIKFISNRQGLVPVPVTESFPVTWIYVNSGTALVARIPYVPGMVKKQRLEVPDDSLRLAAEGDLEMLQAELIDVVARQAVLIARTNKASDKAFESKEWVEVDDLVKLIDGLPSNLDFQNKLKTIRARYTIPAREQGNKFAAQKIEKMCDDFQLLVEKHLDGARVKLLKEHLAELRGGNRPVTPRPPGWRQ